MNSSIDSFLFEDTKEDMFVRYDDMKTLLNDRIPDNRRDGGWEVKNAELKNGNWFIEYSKPGGEVLREEHSDPIHFLGGVTGGADPHYNNIYTPIGVSDGYSVESDSECPHPPKETELVSPYVIQAGQIIVGGKNILCVYCARCNSLIEHVEPDNTLMGKLKEYIF